MLTHVAAHRPRKNAVFRIIGDDEGMQQRRQNSHRPL